MLFLIALLGKVLREIGGLIAQIMQLIRLLGRQVLRPLVRHFPSVGDATEELGKRSLARTYWGERLGWDVEPFLAPGAEQGVEISPWALAEFGAGVFFIAGVAAIAVAIGMFAPPILAGLEAYEQESANAAYMSARSREILERAGFSMLPANLGNVGEQARWDVLHKLNAPPATSGGTAAHDVDDQTTDDYQKLIDTVAPPVRAAQLRSPTPDSQSLPLYNSGGDYSVQTSDALDDAALQLQRLQAIQGGDVSGYNNLLKQHGRQIRKSGRDPGSSGFYPGSGQKK